MSTETVIINGIEYAPVATDSPVKLVVLQRGCIRGWLLRYLDKHCTTSRVKSPEGVVRYMEPAVTETEYQAWAAEQRILRAAEREAAKREDGDAWADHL